MQCLYVTKNPEHNLCQFDKSIAFDILSTLHNLLLLMLKIKKYIMNKYIMYFFSFHPPLVCLAVMVLRVQKMK